MNSLELLQTIRDDLQSIPISSLQFLTQSSILMPVNTRSFLFTYRLLLCFRLYRDNNEAFNFFRNEIKHLDFRN